jgi:hypothetical protein
MSEISEGFCRLADSLIEVFVIVKSFLKYFIYYRVTSRQFAGGKSQDTYQMNNGYKNIEASVQHFRAYRTKGGWKLKD